MSAGKKGGWRCVFRERFLKFRGGIERSLGFRGRSSIVISGRGECECIGEE